MQVMILAAGLGTRLGAIGAEMPKAALPVCGYPAIAFGLALCRAAGLDDVIVNLHHRGDVVRAAVGDGARFGVRVRWSEEPDLLGTGGGIARARPLFRSEPVLVMNAKVVADIDLPAVLAAHAAAPAGRVATMVLHDERGPEERPPVAVDEAGRVVALRGVRAAGEGAAPAAERAFTGVHVLEGRLLDRLPAGVSDVIAAAYLPALLRGEYVASFTARGYFAEHSTPARYLAGNLALLRQPALVSHPPGPLSGVAPAARIDPGARIVPPVHVGTAIVETGAVIGPDAVIGDGARVAPGMRVARSVVWPGVEVSEDLDGAIATPGGVMRV